MLPLRIPNLITSLQTAIGPVILISGVGLLLLTMTNRLARTVDRARAAGARDPHGRERAGSELSVLWRRANILRLSIFFASISALCAALLIIVLFVSAIFAAPLSWLISLLFIAGMLALIVSLVLFIRDVNMALDALDVELKAGASGGTR
ncbi:MAG: DUF2721 domain-containing protein [Elusimicrobia bacterium]|nr:DUF2721 domain-containing protein [Elusimicrobiota bacterium]